MPVEETPVLTLDAIRSICSLRFPDTDFSSVPVEDIAAAIHAVTSTAITPLNRPLDSSLAVSSNAFPHGPTGSVANSSNWTVCMTLIKRSGERRSRSCCDGSLRAAPLLHQVASTYSSCIEQPIQRMFFALAAAHDMQVYGGDATDAFAHSPPPETPTFIMIDDAYAEWYKARFGVTLDWNMVLPVLHALQGHPESGRLWETYINKILSLPELSFRSTTHDGTIYSGVFEGEPILLLRQVDDFALACRRESTAKAVYEFIGKALQQPNEAPPPFTYLGLLSDYNGVDVHQTADYIELTSAGYIDRLLRSHGWDTPSPHESSDDRSAPLPVDAVDRLYQSPAGPSEGSPEHADLCESQGFSYRTLLGELLYAYITCRPDIGYAVVTLSKFASAPHAYHYSCLKGVARYLRRTKHWGIRFARRTHDPSLPPGTPHNLSLDPSLPPFPSIHSPLQLTGYVDAAHANDLRNRRSTTGYAFVLNGGAIAYRSKTQTVAATSSTKAEFIAAVFAAKTAKYLRAVLHELSFPQLSPTPIHIDNVSAIQIINARKPTERSCHIDIQAFAVQDWKDNGDILMHHIPGVINPSDSLTKLTGWVLHSRHCRRIMATWEDMYEQLSQYYGRFGSTLINKKINRELGMWTSELRILYSKGDLDPIWVTKLNQLKFNWDAEDVNWNGMYDRFVAYKKKHGTVCVPHTCPDDPPLGGWVQTNRMVYKHILTDGMDGISVQNQSSVFEIAQKRPTKRFPATIHAKRLSKLLEIGFVWSAFDAQWQDLYKDWFHTKRVMDTRWFHTKAWSIQP
ncbi:helicase domain protein [Nitzschia inconspicua]|uniref:Helicase domain protein n=1 Tax=Nitzschia inconspicua TaxID=303405 RepID=A0A9K3PDP4_9STRA|nr:helicase domain protein [Nitzschia inconspicua]